MFDVARMIKVAKWGRMARQFYKMQLIMSAVAYVPVYLVYHTYSDIKHPIQLALRRPTTDEERLEIKRNAYNHRYQRNWEIDQYQYQIAPVYDLAERRKNYPEHYGKRYDGYKKYDV